MSSDSHPQDAQAHAAPAQDKFSRYQIFVIALMAFLMFTVMVDFMILSPLGAILMHDLGISAAHFGWAVSAYAFSAGISGLLTAGFADRFDRKKLLLFFYAGFVLGTVLCGLAPNYHLLLGARVVTGLFGGVISSIMMAILADLFPLSKRGRVMGFVQTAFAASQVLGIPLGLYLSSLWNWHAPFLMIAAVSAVAGLAIFFGLRPLTGHLKAKHDMNPFVHLFRTVSKGAYLRGFLATTLLTTGGFMLMPFGSAFSVHNLGIPFHKLPTVYMVTGICAVFAGPLAGKLSDRYGKYPVFFTGTVLTMIMVVIYTHLGITPLWAVILVNVLLFICISSRMIPSQALMSAIPDPRDRGAFMSVNTSVQQLAGGIAAGVAGLIVVQTPEGRLERYDMLGFVVCGAMIATLVMMHFINQAVKRKGYKGV
jgi:predicted MFS family arabinose efflux permease